MSFRLRALALLMFIALTATTATAWITLRQATTQIRETASAEQADLQQITTALRIYGATHGTWHGLSATVRQLAGQTGQRIRITTDTDGRLIADSDNLAGRTPRKPGTTAPLLIDPRPQLPIPDHIAAQKTTVVAIAIYHEQTRYAACLTEAGVPVETEPHPLLGFLPMVLKPPPAGNKCIREAYPEARLRGDGAAVQACMHKTKPGLCLRRLFEQRINDVAPPRLQVRLGAVDNTPPTLSATPAITAAAAVGLLVILSALILGRTVLRPVHALTQAARGLGAGDLGNRVPVAGRDEIAQLARAFNRMADSLQASEERQRRLTGDIAHELRTPLANLRGYLEALQDGVLTPAPDLIDALHGEAMLQQRIVDDLQDLALAEAGALTYHHAVIDLPNLLRACHTAHRPHATTAGITLQVDVGIPARIYGDVDRLRQALGNLVTNALRATPPGGTVTLALSADADHATVHVHDTGTGIPTEHMPHLFDRFWRADPARGRTTGGSGLGLAIARQIVTDHHGTITAHSTVGIGTTFTLTLPTRTDTPTPRRS
ncbi:cell wall metabolism sensor histidine kinase WalK [Streptomyces sp. NBC_00233]|uniref:sensor histidine kinase n=1 Tax=Streptomyces sp. NBC_00233 TaxID=2975686 RepID=UPI00224D00AD|nr:ATP-binding protein [Streptomyces sp. NBC_00233]MCX5233346.1 ATP-binding protein [Streptomyces sp. NBC_00233]